MKLQPMVRLLSRSVLNAGKSVLSSSSVKAPASQLINSPWLSSSSLSTSRSSSTKAVEQGTRQTSFLSKLWNQSSPFAQQKRNEVAARLFAAAQRRSCDPIWYGPGRVGRDYRSRHAILTMHVWFLNKRLVLQGDSDSLLIQEELFELFWDETTARIRAAGMNELTVGKHLKDTQQVTFQHLTHYDHAYQEFETDPKKRFEELLGLIWMHILLKKDSVSTDYMQRIASYVEAQYENIVLACPSEYFDEGRIAWVPIPSFEKIEDDKSGRILKTPQINEEDKLPKNWYSNLANTGETYYYNIKSGEATWERPSV